MFRLLAASTIAGIVLGAPFGPAGAMIAEAALSHNRRKLSAITVAAIMGDTTLAALASVFSHQLKSMISQTNRVGLLLVGAILIGMGVIIALQAKTGRKNVSGMRSRSPGSWLAMAHLGPGLAVYVITLLHPGTIAAFLAASALISLHISHFSGWSMVYVTGVFVGSVVVFAGTALLFWRIRHKAARFVTFLRFALALTLVSAGAWLLVHTFIC